MGNDFGDMSFLMSLVGIIIKEKCGKNLKKSQNFTVDLK